MKVTWKNHLNQETESKGEMWGKKHDFVGRVAFGDGERKSRTSRSGRVLRIQRRQHQPVLTVAAAHVQEAHPGGLPQRGHESDRRVEYMAVDSLQQQYAEVDGKNMPSVSGGTRWGGGVWINAKDMARFGYLWLRGGRWGGKQIVPPVT